MIKTYDYLDSGTRGISFGHLRRDDELNYKSWIPASAHYCPE